MATLDSIINFLIPFILFGAFIWIFREPLGKLFKWIVGLFGYNKKEDIDLDHYYSPTIHYE